MVKSAKVEKLHIAIVGRRNVGKSLLLNRVVSQEHFIVNDIPGTTTDPISEVVELLPYGPVVIIDTAGIDDENDFGKKTINKTIKAISSADFAIVVLDAREELDKSETELIMYLRKLQVPFLVAVNKIEFGTNPHLLTELEALEVTYFEISCKENAGVDNFKKKLIHLLPGEKEKSLIEDLVRQGDVVLMTVPNDFGELNGRAIESQVQKIREALSGDINCIVVKNSDLKDALAQLKNTPDLVVANNQAIEQIAVDLPESVKLTTYSILLARQEGNLTEFVKGIQKVKKLENGDKVLISEACDHHLQEYDIGNAKIQGLLKLHTKKNLHIDIYNGSGFPANLSEYQLIIHCDGCMLSKKERQVRIKQATLLGIPIVNYGVLISYIRGFLPRVLLPFEDAIPELGIIRYT